MKTLSVLLTLLLLFGASRLSAWMKRNRSLPADRQPQTSYSATSAANTTHNANATHDANRFHYR